MIWTLDQVKAVAAGVHEARVMRDTCRFHRFPSAMWTLYAGNEGSLARASASTGVRLRFRSDSRWIRLTLRYGEPSRWYFQGVVRVDDDRSDAFGPVSRQARWRGRVFEQDDRTPHVFDIWLPHLCSAEVEALELEDGSTIEAAPPLAFTWLAYGDSITQGANASLPVFTWTARCALAFGADLVNFGVGGATFHSVLVDAVPATPCKVITVSYGVNDFNVGIPEADVAARAAALLQALKRAHPAARIVLTTPVPFFRPEAVNARGATLDDYRTVLEDVAGAAGVACIRGTDLVPADPAYFSDRAHPNDSGMGEIARVMQTKLRALGV